MTRKLHWETRKYLFNTKEGSDGEIEQEIHNLYRKQIKCQA